MVYKVLSIVAGILMSLMTLVFVVCLVYTLSSSAVRAGFDSVSAAIEGAVAQATEAMDTEWDIDLSWLFGDAAASGSGASGGGLDVLGGIASLASGGAGDSAADFADLAQGQAYLAWKDRIADPVTRIFAGSGVTAEMIEGVAGGSSSASDALAALDETALAAISANAASYAATAAANAVPASLPEAARSSMQQANDAAQGFAASVQSVVSAVREVRSGALGSLGTLVGAANDALANLRAIDGCMQSAEAALK